MRKESVGVHCEHDIITGFRSVASYYVGSRDGAYYGNVDRVVIAIGVRMPADYRNVEFTDRALHALKKFRADLSVIQRYYVDHRQRPSSHGGYIVHVNQNGKIAGVERVRFHQGFHDPVRREQYAIVPVLYGGGILSLGCDDIRE
jgi:hypothetical protein